jgi:quercetin dioxygenase-like cupin family protein
MPLDRARKGAIFTVMKHVLSALVVSLTVGLAQAASPPTERVTETPGLRQPLPNVPGKWLSSVLVDYPPGAASAPHRHGDASVYAYVLAGAIRSQVDDGPVRIYRAGDSWFEPPGTYHAVSENASATEPARLLAVFVADDGATLTIPDHH